MTDKLTQQTTIFQDMAKFKQTLDAFNVLDKRNPPTNPATYEQTNRMGEIDICAQD